MKHIVSFSGGRTSAYLVHLMEQKRKNEGLDVEYVFMDTGAEHPKTYDFVRACVEYFNIELTVLKAVINQEMGVGVSYKIIQTSDMGWDLSLFKEMIKKYSTPCLTSPFSNGRLKTEPMMKYIASKNLTEYKQWLGMRIDEKRRLKDKPNIKYLAEISQMEKEDIIGWWKEMPFDLDLPEWLGNCVFCYKKSVSKIALAIKQEPDLYKEWKEIMIGFDVRDMSDKRGVTSDVIYRGNLSIEGIAEIYADKSEDEIKATLRRSKRHDSGCGSESCEIDFDQLDMFKEIK